MNPQQRLSALKTNTAALLGQVALATEAAKAAETERLVLERQLSQLLNTHEFTGSPAHQDVLAAISNAEAKSLEAHTLAQQAQAAHDDSQVLIGRCEDYLRNSL